jgi:hypothetical protein
MAALDPSLWGQMILDFEIVKRHLRLLIASTAIKDGQGRRADLRLSIRMSNLLDAVRWRRDGNDCLEREAAPEGW